MSEVNPRPGRDDADDVAGSAVGVPRPSEGGGTEAPRLFTVHVEFLARDEVRARQQAQAYAEALVLLRPEVDCYTARISVCGHMPASRVYCGSPGPDPSDVCIDTAGHPGGHHGHGLTGRWDERDVPQAPDDLSGIG